MRLSVLTAHERGGGARTTAPVNPSLGASAFINGITWFAPGSAIPFHSHNCEESVMLKILWRHGRIDATRTITETGQTHPVCAEHARRVGGRPLGAVALQRPESAGGR